MNVGIDHIFQPRGHGEVHDTQSGLGISSIRNLLLLRSPCFRSEGGWRIEDIQPLLAQLEVVLQMRKRCEQVRHHPGGLATLPRVDEGDVAGDAARSEHACARFC